MRMKGASFRKAAILSASDTATSSIDDARPSRLQDDTCRSSDCSEASGLPALEMQSMRCRFAGDLESGNADEGTGSPRYAWNSQ